MSELYPTKTRLALLRAVALGRVLDLPDEDRNRLESFDTSDAEDGEPARRVTARVTELARAGWIACPNGVTWGLTRAGRQILEADQ